MEEDGRRWKKKMEKIKKFKKKKNIFFEVVGDGLGTLIGVQMAPKTRLRL